MSTKNSLKKYKEKRDFRKSPEPADGVRRRTPNKPIFVIQKHAARNLHYDFRLEVKGVLKSWAVPKGPSTNPRVKRAAFAVEDHPLSYAKFEGVIPKGEYGAGVVMVWDIGTYSNITEKDGKSIPIDQALKNGHASVKLNGKKLRGGFALTRVEKGEKERWLLIKMRDDDADARRNPLKSEPNSALTGRTMKQIEHDEER